MYLKDIELAVLGVRCQCRPVLCLFRREAHGVMKGSFNYLPSFSKKGLDGVD